MSAIRFTYSDGTPVNQGDRVIVENHRMASVELLLQPGTEESTVWQCCDTGGILLKFDDGDCWLCREGLDEDFEKQAGSEMGEGST